MQYTENIFSLNDTEIKRVVELSHLLTDIADAICALGWDQDVCMPSGGAESRANQIATLSMLAHERLSDPQVGELLHSVEARIALSQNYTIYDKALVMHLARDHDNAVKVPKTLVGAISSAHSAGCSAWKVARAQSNFDLFKKELAEVIRLNKEWARCIKTDEQSLYDAFLDKYDEGLTTDFANKILSDTKDIILRILPALEERFRNINDDFLQTPVSRNELEPFTLVLLKNMGFDFQRGRQDTATHPSTASLGLGDVRLTNRYGEKYFTNSIFSSLHEGGHGLYEQGIDSRLRRTAIGNMCLSLSMHESQSRFWENIVGRSREFWQYWYPILNVGALDGVSQKEFLLAINRVVPGLIRVDADEVTYGLHIILRFELEKQIINEDINIDILPELWNNTFEQYLGGSGLRVPNDASGVLQDIHWSEGLFGYFPTYALGNVLAAQWYYTIKQAIPDFCELVERNNLTPIREWFRHNIYQHGSVYTMREIVESVAGESINPKYFEQYLNEKFQTLFSL